MWRFDHRNGGVELQSGEGREGLGVGQCMYISKEWETMWNYILYKVSNRRRVRFLRIGDVNSCPYMKLSKISCMRQCDMEA